jgi:DNA-binding response OmpR family regulator
MEKILVICDNPKDRYVCRLLEEAGYEVSESTFGSVTTDAFDSTGLVLVILDVSFSGTGVHDLCRHIRNTYDNVSIFVISIVSDVNEVVQALKLGADGYMMKPFNPIEFLARIRVQLRNRKVLRLDS